jgi:hypothetical protein
MDNVRIEQDISFLSGERSSVFAAESAIIEII